MNIRLLTLLVCIVIPLHLRAQPTTFSGKNLPLKKLDDLIYEQMQRLDVAGFSLAVISDGKMQHRRHYGVTNWDRQTPIWDESIFEAASMTKPVFGWLVMRLVERGELDLDRPLYEILPYDRLAHDVRYKQITARMVLSHTTGLPNWAYGRRLELAFDPGTGWNYSGEGFVYLGKVVEKITGKPLDQVFDEEVFEPLGMSSSKVVWDPLLVPLKVDGHYYGNIVSTDYYHNTTANPAASLLTNVEDFSKFMIAVMNRKGLKKKSYQELFKQQSAPAKDDSHQNEEANLAWGLGWVLEETPFGLKLQHGGNNGDFQSYFELSADGKHGYVCFSNSDRGGKLNKVLKPYLTDLKLIGYEGEDRATPIRETKVESSDFKGEEWELEGTWKRTIFRGKEAIALINEGTVTLNKEYKNALIEFDIAMPEGAVLGGVKFRMQDEYNYENFYLRMHEDGAEHALQYTPVFNDYSAWQLYHGSNYCRSAFFRNGDWMHVRIAIFDDWMEVYLNRNDRLALHVFDLKHAIEPGQLQLWSSSTCYFTNFSVQELEDYDFFYDRQPKPTPAEGTVLEWDLSNAFMDGQMDFTAPYVMLPESLAWRKHPCEYNGVINLARYEGPFEENDTRIARFTIESDKDQRKRLQFGYSDIGKLLLNGKIIYEGQRIFGSRDDSYYGTIGYFDNVYLDLKKGRNEVWFVVTENFGGWGVMARFSDLEGITLK